MISQASLCTRCGKTRTIAKTWEEKIEVYSGASIVKHALYICPDESCQQKVENALQAQKQASLDRQKASERREQARSEQMQQRIKNNQKASAKT